MSTFKCYNCGCNESFTKIIDYPTNWGEHSILFKGVPAIKCSKCSETLFTSGVARLTQKIVKAFSINKQLSDIAELNIAEIVNVVKTEQQQNCLANALIKNKIQPKLVDNKYIITESDAMFAIAMG